CHRARKQTSAGPFCPRRSSCGEDHRMPLGLLEDHLSNVKQRIRPARHLDLARQGFDAFVLGAQAQVEFGQRQRRRTPIAVIAPAKIRSRAAHRPAAITFRPWRAAACSRRAPTIAAWATAVPSRSGWTIATGRARTATVPVAIAAGSLGFAFVLGVLGGRRLLRPGREEEFV